MTKRQCGEVPEIDEAFLQMATVRISFRKSGRFEGPAIVLPPTLPEDTYCPVMINMEWG